MSAILVLGEPGTGKSAAIEELDSKSTVIFSPNYKDLPFPGGDVKYSIANKNRFFFNTFKGVGDAIKEANKQPHIKTIIVEDFTHYMSKKAMDDSGTKGYDKWTELAVLAFTNVVELITTGLRPDVDCVLIGHVNAVVDASGNMEIGIQTAGKLMDNVIKIPSYFTYIFHAWVDYDGEEPLYVFQTNRDNRRLAKSSKGMFPFLIANDYKVIFDRIRSYRAGRIEENIVPPIKAK